MPAYWVARAKVNDPVEYRKYADRVPAILAKYGARVLARGGRYRILEGPEKFNRFVVIEFPTLEQGVACFDSREYKEAAASLYSRESKQATPCSSVGNSITTKRLNFSGPSRIR